MKYVKASSVILFLYCCGCAIGAYTTQKISSEPKLFERMALGIDNSSKYSKIKNKDVGIILEIGSAKCDLFRSKDTVLTDLRDDIAGKLDELGLKYKIYYDRDNSSLTGHEYVYSVIYYEELHNYASKDIAIETILSRFSNQGLFGVLIELPSEYHWNIERINYYYVTVLDGARKSKYIIFFDTKDLVKNIKDIYV